MKILLKKTDLKEILELISKYSNNSLVRNLSVPEKLFLYEAKKVFDLHYFNTKPAYALFLYTRFKIKYVCDTILSPQERRLDIDKIIDIIMESKFSSPNPATLTPPSLTAERLLSVTWFCKLANRDCRL